MNLSQFLQTIDNYTSQMPKDALAVCFHEIARVLPEEQRDWMLSVMERNGAGVSVSEPEAIVPESLYDQLEKIRSGEYRLDSEYNEAWDDWYAEEEPEFVFEDGDGLLDIVDAACAELHRLVECAAFPEAYQLGERLISLDVQTDGDYSDFDKDTLDVEDLEDYALLTPVHYLRALLNSPDYEQSRAELQEIADSVQESEMKGFLPTNHITEETRRFMRFLNGEFQNAYADLQKTYKDYKPLALKQGIALTALFLYPEETLRQGGQAMCHFLTRELPFDAAAYCRGLGTASETDSTSLLWTCLLQCRQHTPLPDREHAVGLLRTLCTNMTDYVMQHNERCAYPECAALAAVLGEILEAEGTIPAKNDFLLQCKNLYPRRTAYHRELRTYGMRDGKK